MSQLDMAESLDEAVRIIQENYKNGKCNDLDDDRISVFVRSINRNPLKKMKIKPSVVKKQLRGLEDCSFITLGEFIYNKDYQDWFDCQTVAKHNDSTYSLIYIKKYDFCWVKLDSIHVSEDDIEIDKRKQLQEQLQAEDEWEKKVKELRDKQLA